MQLLAGCPRISERDGGLIAATAWRWRVLFLGTMLREVVVDPGSKMVLIHCRYLWFFPFRRRIPFAKIAAVTYGYEDLSTGAGWSPAHNTFDAFAVGLQLVDDAEIPLFSFYGEGTFVNESGLPDWMYWGQSIFGVVGRQEHESRAFVDSLAKMIGVKVTRPRT